VAEDDADCGALAAQPEAAAPLSRLAVRCHDPRWEPGAVVPLAGICTGGGEQSPTLPRLCYSNGLRTTRIAVDVAWRIVSASGGIDLLQRQTGAMLNDIAAVESWAGSDASSVLSPQS
jgi:hypothetical protein